MGTITGNADDIIYSSDMEEEYRSLPDGGEICIAKGDWRYVDNKNIAASGNKRVTIYGDGGPDNAVITTAPAIPGHPPTDALLFNSTRDLRITQLTLKCSDPTLQAAACALSFGPSSYSSRQTRLIIDHCDLVGYGCWGYNRSGPIQIRGYCSGVIFKCRFKNTPPPEPGWGYGLDFYGSNIWTTDISPFLGTAGLINVLVIEDCEFENCRHVAAIDGAAALIIRHCTVRNGVWEAQFESHAGLGSRVGAVFQDIYEIDVDAPISGSGKLCQFRSGKMFVHNVRCNTGGAYKNLVESRQITPTTPYFATGHIWDNEGDYSTTFWKWPNSPNVDFKLYAYPGYEFPIYPHYLREGLSVPGNPVNPLKGDINEDGVVNAADISALEKLIADGE